RLTENLTHEAKRREGVEQQAGEIGQRRTELETQLAETKKAEAGLRQELEKAQHQQQTQQQSSGAEQTKLETRIKELEAAKVALDQKLKQVGEGLAQETKRRESAEQQSV